MTPPAGARCTILGGTNGSGKSSFFNKSPVLQLSGELVNADVIARSISPEFPELVSTQAGRRVISRLAELIAFKRDFIVETTLSSRQSLTLMKAARDAGYHVALVFLVLRTVDLHVLRVHERVSRGGHFIRDDVIRRRYARAMANLPEAIRLSREVVIYDNSLTSPVKLVELSAGKILHNRLDRTKQAHREIAVALSDALGVGPAVVFRKT